MNIEDIPVNQRVILFDVINGLRSGIPECCVVFYAARSAAGELVAKSVYASRGGLFVNGAEYVQCDECFAAKRWVPLVRNGVVGTWLLPKRDTP